MAFGRDDIAAEHRAVVASLSPEQRRAVQRVHDARRRSLVNGLTEDENLRTIFETEAASRTQLDRIEHEHARLAA